MWLNCRKKIKAWSTAPALNSDDAERLWLQRDRILRSLDLGVGITSQTTWAILPVTVLNTERDVWTLHNREAGFFLLVIFTKVCFFPSLHSRVYPEWFNYNFPCVRQIKEESRSVVPSTLFISITDCSSPTPRAAGAGAEAASRSPQNVRLGLEKNAAGRETETSQYTQNKIPHSTAFFQQTFTYSIPKSFQKEFLT